MAAKGFNLADAVQANLSDNDRYDVATIINLLHVCKFYR